MKPRAFDPLRLDVEAFAGDAATLAGEWPLDELPRVVDLQVVDAPERRVEWQAAGQRRAGTGGASETWIVLRARTTLDLPCQRCLDAVEVPIDVDRAFRFVVDEATAEVLDEELEDDVLATSRAFDLRALVEDELLLAAPLVPRHEACPRPVKWRTGEEQGADVANPFAALAALKKPPAAG